MRSIAETGKDGPLAHTAAINQSISVRFVGRRYTTRPGAPAIVSCKPVSYTHLTLPTNREV